MSEKNERFERTLERFLSERIAELKDPRVPVVVTVERVRLSSDFGTAKVLVSTLGDDQEHQDLRDALERASGFLQREIASELDFRKTPRLSFHVNPLEVV